MIKHGKSTGFPSQVGISVLNRTTSTIILPAANQLGLDHIAGDTTVNSYDIDVVDSTGMSVGDHFRIINTLGDRFFFSTILNIVGNTLTMDRPVDYTYLDGSEVTYSNINMAVDGSITPIHFHLRTGTPSIPSSVDITRIIIMCECSGAVDLNKFGDISGGLTRGLLFRKLNGDTHNILNVKTNLELAGLTYDFTVFDATHPTQGINGFATMLTFAGENKIGTALRITQYGQLGLIVQDDLSSLTSLQVVFEGHVTTEREMRSN